MLAKFEKSTFTQTTHTSVNTYQNLHNLPHWHRENEIIYISSGKVNLTINNNSYLLKPGECAFIKSEEIHFINSEYESITHVIKTDALGAKSILNQKRLVTPILQKNYMSDKFFTKVKDELKNSKKYNDIIVESILTCFIAEIFRSEKTQTEESQNVCDRYKKLLRWLEENYANITFEDAARYMNFCNPYFSKYFQKLSGMTFTEYMNTLKISAAIEKIAAGEMNITEISISCGFNTIRHFNRIFKKLTGYTPKSLPDNYIFKHRTDSGIGFDPTLNNTIILE